MFVIPLAVTNSDWVSVHDYETTHEESENKNEKESSLKVIEVREFIADNDYIHNLANVPVFQNSRIKPGDSYLERTYYLSIPTPPPDKG